MRWLAALLCALSLAAQATPTDDLKTAALGVLKAQAAVEQGSLAGFTVSDEVAVLDRLIGKAELNEAGLAIAHFYRGRAALLANQVRASSRQKPDAVAAKRALADFDWVIEKNQDVPSVGVWVADAGYSAGVVARNYLGALSLAYDYWSECAQRGHAGCMNVMASAKITGAGGVKVDIAGALDLHAKVYATGTAFDCAGAYSALASAQIVHFGTRVQAAAGELEWLKRADALLDLIAKERGLRNPCSRGRFKLTEYLVRLDRDDARRELIESAGTLAEQPEEKAVAGYLLGSVNETAFRQIAAKGTDKDAVCEMHFTAYWHALIRRDAKLAGEHQKAMKALGGDHCAVELALAGMRASR